MKFARIITTAALVIATSAPSPALGPPAEESKSGETDLGYFYALGEHRTQNNKRTYVVLENPVYAPGGASDLADDEAVIGLMYQDRAYCFPIRLMTYHHISHIVHDRKIGSADESRHLRDGVAVTYCAMANSAVAFDPRWGDMEGERGTPIRLAVAGSYAGTLVVARSLNYIWNFDTALTYHPQINPTAPMPDGKMSDWKLELGPPLIITDYGHWRRKYPETLVLQPDPKFADKYAEYDAKPKGYSILKERDRTIKMRDKRLSPGREVFGVAMGQNSVAWTLEEIKHRKQIFEPLNGELIHIAWDQELDAPVVVNPPKNIIATRCYWYSWSSFYPGGPLNGKFAVPGDIEPLATPAPTPTPIILTATVPQSTGRAEE